MAYLPYVNAVAKVEVAMRSKIVFVNEYTSFKEVSMLIKGGKVRVKGISVRVITILF